MDERSPNDNMPAYLQLWPDDEHTRHIAHLSNEDISISYDFPKPGDELLPEEARREPSPPLQSDINVTIDHKVLDAKYSAEYKTAPRALRKALAHSLLWDEDQNNRKTLDFKTGIPGEEAYEADLLLASGRTDIGYVYMDIDGFKNVNDTLGHQAGDEVLKFVAHVIQSTVVQYDKSTAYRLHGDEFAVITESPYPERIAKACEEAVARAFEELEHLTTKQGSTISKKDLGLISITAGTGSTEHDADIHMLALKKARKESIQATIDK